MLASQIRRILERGSLESRFLALKKNAHDSFPALSEPKYSSEEFLPDERDQGYFAISDNYRQRCIYVSTKAVAENASFLSTMQIEHVLDLTNEPEVHYMDVTIRERIRVLDGMIHSVQLIMACEGNIVVHCRHGRTRSPALLAAYLMIVACMSQEAAYSFLSSEYIKQRRLDGTFGIDRLNRYIGNLNDMMKLIE